MKLVTKLRLKNGVYKVSENENNLGTIFIKNNKVEILK